MRLRLILPLVAVLAVVIVVAPFAGGFLSRTLPAGGGPVPADRCYFQPEIRMLRSEIPEVVGDCLENQRYNPDNGDTIQRTTGGLIVWRKGDRTTAFTDGARTWAHGPNGLETRSNDRRFEWETPSVPPANPKAGETPIPQAAAAATKPAGPTATPRPVVVSTPQANLGAGLGGATAALIPSTGELISTATELTLVSSLKSSGLPVQSVRAATADTDPDKQLGKPGQYTSKILWVDQRAPNDEATIELFADEKSLKARQQAIDASASNPPAFTQHIFADPKSRALLRLPKVLTPQQAQGYEKWLSTIR